MNPSESRLRSSKQALVHGRNAVAKKMTPTAWPPEEIDQAQILRFIEDRGFPCVGAKAALKQENLQIIHGGDLRSDHSDAYLVAKLQAFAIQAPAEAEYLSVISVFGQTPLLAEADFERALWQRLQALHNLDAQDYRWDRAVSSDPVAPTFGMSFGGRAFYVVGLHPGASRASRRFPQAALVFNLHSQFQRLRESGLYGKLKDTITARDVALSGCANPMLAAHGERSEARQYSGRVVEDEWVCPFRAVETWSSWS